MKKASTLFIMVICAVAALYTSASAGGIGFYGSFSYLNVNVEDASADNYLAGAGLVFDTAVAKDSIFNYRLNLGAGMIIDKPENISLSDATDARQGLNIELINSFGFGIVRISFLRLWLGPQIGLRYVHIETDNVGASTSDFNIDRLIFLPGAVLGFNFNLGSVFTIGIDGGFRYNIGFTTETFSSTSSVLDSDLYTTHGPEAFVNLSFIFRINDDMD